MKGVVGMNQKRISHLLIAAGALAAAGILALALLYAPALASACLEAFKETPNIQGLYRFGLAGVWTESLIFLLALAEYMLISVRIGRNRSFCPENVRGLRRIALYLSVDGVLWLLAIIAPSFIFHILIGPVWMLFLLVSMGTFALALLAWCLGGLLSRAVEIQRENDLTV